MITKQSTSAGFAGLKLSKPILRALAEEGYTQPTPIQSAAIPQLLAGRDLMATAQTGTGKTAAFALPILQLLSDRRAADDRGGNRDGIRVLVLAPTRELVLQIDESFRAYGRHLPFRTAVVMGGVSMGGQIKAISRKPEILVATPGRLLDLYKQGHLQLGTVEKLVLDEADRMLDMGFVHDVRRIAGLTPRKRQTILFSATLTATIAGLASDMLDNPAYVEVAPSASVSGKISQKVMFVQQSDKFALLASILRDKSTGRALVFTRTKHKADRIVRSLMREGVTSESIHSNKTQRSRERALTDFERGRVRVLVATDIVSRGIDVDGISHVINYEMPGDVESYVHRIGRTARAGADGIAYSFCGPDDLALLRAIEKRTQAPLDAYEDHPYHSDAIGALRNRSLSGGFTRTRTRRFASRGRRVYR